MTTLYLLQFLEDNGFGKIDTNLFWEKLTLDRNGIYVASIGEPTERGALKSQSYEIYSRGRNDYEGYQQLKEIVDFLEQSFDVCTLPAYEHKGANLENITIMPPSTITNYGLDSNGRIIFSATGRILLN